MIQRAVTAIIGVVIGLFATFAVFSAILGGLDSFYLLTQDACNYGSENAPKRVLRVAPENAAHPGDADEIDWTADGLDVVHDGDGGCQVQGSYDPAVTYLTPTGDELPVSVTAGAMASMPASVPLSSWQISDAGSTGRDDNLGWRGVWADGATLHMMDHDPNNGQLSFQTFNRGGGYRHSDALTTNRVVPPWGTDDDPRGMVATDDHYWLAYETELRSLTRPGLASGPTISLNAGHHPPSDLAIAGGHIYVLVDDHAYAYSISGRSHDSPRTAQFSSVSNSAGIWIDDDGGLWVSERVNNYLYYQSDYRDANSASVKIDAPRQIADEHMALDSNYRAFTVSSGNLVWLDVFGPAGSGVGVALSMALNWIPAENVFTAQQQLVTLLAVIAAIGMPIGAMTAIVFFGQAVISSGVSGQGASQVLVAIAAVVVILVAVQMFQQFAGYLGNAFDAVNGDRFVVFDETLGSLAETIAEFWGVLAFAGLINIATIVWRNYSGNFSIGGTQGGL